MVEDSFRRSRKETYISEYRDTDAATCGGEGQGKEGQGQREAGACWGAGHTKKRTYQSTGTLTQRQEEKDKEKKNKDSVKLEHAGVRVTPRSVDILDCQCKPSEPPIPLSIVITPNLDDLLAPVVGWVSIASAARAV
ncbi:unnamed protein product [Heligmosomoides polygyrus]|uniref:Uncharacterized protein n=1 Tax=Heligmosomoides polygyrus TaxID=6339 RepID=A0A183FFZ3_HELPZ|nr:unnamed protein product [Heligmosomoides polygyrus]